MTAQWSVWVDLSRIPHLWAAPTVCFAVIRVFVASVQQYLVGSLLTFVLSNKFLFNKLLLSNKLLLVGSLDGLFVWSPTLVILVDRLGQRVDPAVLESTPKQLLGGWVVDWLSSLLGLLQYMGPRYVPSREPLRGRCLFRPSNHTSTDTCTRFPLKSWRYHDNHGWHD